MKISAANIITREGMISSWILSTMTNFCSIIIMPKNIRQSDEEYQLFFQEKGNSIQLFHAQKITSTFFFFFCLCRWVFFYEVAEVIIRTETMTGRLMIISEMDGERPIRKIRPKSKIFLKTFLLCKAALQSTARNLKLTIVVAISTTSICYHSAEKFPE